MVRVISNDPTLADLKASAVAVRTGEHHGIYRQTGSVLCLTCGGYIGGLTKVAAAIGVSASTLNKWLKRETIRQDLADRIRSAFARIEE